MTASYRIVVTSEARDEVDELHAYISVGRHATISVLDFARYHGGVA